MRPPRDDARDTQAFYDNQAATSFYRDHTALLPKETVAFSYIPPRCTILDVGCGTGRTTKFLRDGGHEVIGIDLSLAMIRAAKQDILHIPFLVGNACSVCFRTSHFDVVVFSNNGIDHIYPYENRLQALREIRSVLKPGGLFIFSSHNNCIPRDRDGIFPFFQSLFKKKRDVYIMDTWHPWAPTKMYLTTPSLQVKELEEQGFEMISIVPRRLLKYVKSLTVLGLLDTYVYYVCRAVEVPHGSLYSSA